MTKQIASESYGLKKIYEKACNKFAYIIQTLYLCTPKDKQIGIWRSW